jgi:hypothetical protein
VCNLQCCKDVQFFNVGKILEGRKRLAQLPLSPESTQNSLTVYKNVHPLVIWLWRAGLEGGKMSCEDF